MRRCRGSKRALAFCYNAGAMEPTPEFIRQLDREALEDARRMTLDQKLRAGAELFDYACEITKGGIRMQNPTFTPEQVVEELRRRIAIRTRRENQ